MKILGNTCNHRHHVGLIAYTKICVGVGMGRGEAPPTSKEGRKGREREGTPPADPPICCAHYFMLCNNASGLEILFLGRISAGL